MTTQQERRTKIWSMALATTLLLAGTSADAGARPAPTPTPAKTCPADSVVSGTVCMDTYEAGVWRVPSPTGINQGLVAKIQAGTATMADLNAGGAFQLGINNADDYAPCGDDGQTCANQVFAVSLPGVHPSANVTWFQAQQACKNSRKRLPTNAEWQAAVAGTPDPGPDDGVNDCNTKPNSTTSTGSRHACVSDDGAFDMVGNVMEWTADWVPRTADCGSWDLGTWDEQCFRGVDPTQGPGAVVRGGRAGTISAAGPFAIDGNISPSAQNYFIGFRCAR